MTSFRIAGAPISWGVCEVPGWGYQLGPDQVLAEMREVGLLATELGPDGFLPHSAELGRRKKQLCAEYGFHGLYPFDNEIPPNPVGWGATVIVR